MDYGTRVILLWPVFSLLVCWDNWDYFQIIYLDLLMVQPNPIWMLVRDTLLIRLILTSQQCHVVVANLIRTVPPQSRHLKVLNHHVTRTVVIAHLPEGVWYKKHHLQLSLLIYSLYIVHYCLRRLAIFYMYLVFGALLFWLLWCALRIKPTIFLFLFLAIINELQEPLQFDVIIYVCIIKELTHRSVRLFI